MNNIKNRHSGLVAIALLATLPAFAQRGNIESQTYEIVKEKSIEFPVANRLFDKVQPMEAKTTDKKVTYEFIDPKINLASPKLTPSVSRSESVV